MADSSESQSTRKRRNKNFLWNPNVDIKSRRKWKNKGKKNANDEPPSLPVDEEATFVNQLDQRKEEDEEEEVAADSESEYEGCISSDSESSQTDEEAEFGDNDPRENTRYHDTSAEDLINPEYKRPLWRIPPGEYETTSQLSRMESFLASMSWAVGTCASNQQFTSVLKLLKLHMPDVNEGARSVDFAKKVFSQTNGDEFQVIKFDYCHKCKKLFSGEEEECPGASCNGKRFSDQTKKSRAFFYALNAKAQVASLLNCGNQWSEIRKFKEKIVARRATQQSLITDITDGAEYVKLYKDKGFLSCPNNISFLVNTDGVPLFKSTKFSIWPLYLVINELPPYLRFLRKNVILWGVWFGPEKPKMETFLTPFVQDMQVLRDDGVEITYLAETITIRALFLACTVDLQAKSIILDMIAHNGYCSCSYCDDPGHAPKNKKGRKQHAYAFDGEGTPRTKEQWKKDAQEAMQTGQKVKGIRSLCPLAQADWFDPVLGFVIDYMHGILIGITSALLEKWFSPKSYKEDYFIGHRVEEVDTRLMGMRPPNFISRLPRKIETSRKYWKASEMRNWLMYYALPCLDGILPDKYFNNFSFLVNGVYLLLKDAISRSDVLVADYCLNKFYLDAESYYGGCFCGLNVHHLKHMAKCVEDWGPLWAFSCFVFESANGNLLKFVHGTRSPVEQILYMVCMSTQVVSQTPLLRQGTQVQRFVEQMLGPRKSAQMGLKLRSAKEWSVIGKRFPSGFPNEICEEASRILSCESAALEKSTRMARYGDMFYSADYGKFKTCGYCVEYEEREQYGTIQYYLFCDTAGDAVAVIKPLQLVDKGFDTPTLDDNCTCHIRRVSQDEGFKIIRISSVRGKAALLEGFQGRCFVASIPNRYERD